MTRKRDPLHPCACNGPACIVSSHSEKNAALRSSTSSGSTSFPRVSKLYRRLDLAHEGDQRLLLRLIQLQTEDEVEKVHGIFKRQESAIMQVRRGILDAAQGEGLDRPFGVNPLAIDHAWLIEALDLQVVHLIVKIEGSGM